MEAPNDTSTGIVRVALKNARRESVVELRIRASSAVRDLKSLIENEYPENPPRECITLVYAGKVLQDDAILSDVFALAGSVPPGSGEGVVAVHMVVKHVEQKPEISFSDASETLMPTPPPPYSARVDGPVEGDSAGNTDAQLVDDGTMSNRVSDNSDVQERASDNTPPEGTPTSRSCRTSETVRPVQSNATRPSHLRSTSVYNAVLKASYEAALRTIMEEAVTSQASGFTFIPAMIPVPRSVTAGPRRRRAREDEDANDIQEAHMGYIRAIFGPLGLNDARIRRERLEVPRPVDQEVNREDNQNARNAERILDNNNGNRRQYLIRIHINVRTLFQLALAGFILYQHCPPSRMLALCLIGMFFYLSSTRFGRRILHRVLQGGQLPEENPVAGPMPAQQLPRAQQRVGWLREVQSFILGFLASLLPAADDAARLPDNVDVAQGGLGAQRG